MTVNIREMTIDDYDALLQIWRDADLSHRPKGRDTRERIDIEMQRKDTAFIGMFESDRLIAVGLATFDGRKGWINRVAVHPDFRRQGLAAVMVGECETFLESLGAEIISCLIEDFNTPSIELFKKLGYSYGSNVMYFSKRKSWDT